MPSRAEECLQKAIECEEKARTAKHDDISNSFRRLAAQWRVLAKIVRDGAAIQADRR
jgi:hypothetical protein